MSLVPFPERIDPYRLFTRNGSLDSEMPLKSFRRFNEYLSEHEGRVAIHLDFGYDEQNRRLVTGSLRSRVVVQCQRCLGSLTLDLDADLVVRVVASDTEAQAMPVEMESVLADEEGIDLLAMVEDELILSLPLVPFHDDERCNETLNRLKDARQDGTEEENAFAVLKNLKADH